MKHIARTRGLAYIIESTDPDPLKTFNALRTELSAYSDELARKDGIVVVSKYDLLAGDRESENRIDTFLSDLMQQRKKISPKVSGSEDDENRDGTVIDVCTVSAVDRSGIESLKSLLERIGTER